MERVTGIGGFFFRTSDPERITAWYAEHLGVDPPPPSYDTSSWWQHPGPTVLAGMPVDSAHFGGLERSWSISFRVADLDAMVDQLSSAGVEMDVDVDEYNGRFASLRDPDGNIVQLWQPAGADARGPILTSELELGRPLVPPRATQQIASCSRDYFAARCGQPSVLRRSLATVRRCRCRGRGSANTTGGTTSQRIGQATGMTRQSAHERWHQQSK